jgi:hypothetical protein
MLTIEQFRALMPEFDAVEDAIVQNALTAAANRTDTEVFAEHENEAHRYLAAHILCSDPSGREARIKNNPADPFGTVYLASRKELETLCCAQWITG